jgi:hypothetical protein
MTIVCPAQTIEVSTIVRYSAMNRTFAGKQIFTPVEYDLVSD